MKFVLPAILLFIILLQSCDTDFDVIAPYKEVIVIDGLLNANDSIQKVRISKAFLGEGNAYVMASNYDSIYYGDILEVRLEKILNNQVTSITLTRSEAHDKDSGVFYYPDYVFYTSQSPILQDGSKYRITVTNTQTGVTASSTTQIVKDLVLQTPSHANMDSIDIASGNSPFNIVYSPGANSKICDLIFRFHYREIDPQGNSTDKYIDWNFTDQTFSNTPAEVKYNFRKNDWFRILGENIPDLPGYTRRIDSLANGAKPVELICLAGTEDLMTYLQLQAPLNGIAQERPVFTTVENGLGLFTSRLIRPEFRWLNSKTMAAFDTSVYTRNLNFKFD